MKWALTLGLLLLTPPARADEAATEVKFQANPGSLVIVIGDEPFATYVYDDPAVYKDDKANKIKRPYFAHVKAAGGVQVTRNHPPVERKDPPDHATLHPGIWMSFGDVSGSDYWRQAARVKFEKFTDQPKGDRGKGSFAVRFAYLDQRQPQQIICHEGFRCQVRVVPNGRLILWDSTFSGDKEFYFGDQEEMGIGFRVATPIRAERESKIGMPPGNGEIRSSSGARNEKEIWGNTADWCDYHGELNGQSAGIAILCHPKNFRSSWFHARDYGLLEANPFGRAAFGKGEPSKVVVKPGEKLRLRYGVLIHTGKADIADAYRGYVKLADE